MEIGTQSFYNIPGFLVVLAYNKTANYLYMKQFFKLNKVIIHYFSVKTKFFAENCILIE